MALCRFIAKSLWQPSSSSIRSASCHHNIALSRDIHKHAKFQLNRKPGSGSNLQDFITDTGQSTKMARHIADIIILSAQITGRAFARALREELESSRQMARARSVGATTRDIDATVTTGLSLQEAMEILNVNKLDREVVEKNYEHLFKVNDRTRGGTLYIQSKIFRAKQRIDKELELK